VCLLGARSMDEEEELELGSSVGMKAPHAKALSRALKAARAQAR
jgi:hypothetical protein